ncbi:hypothetical protein BO94DRAFT_18492 [Aspergillus sclerotioniger CBS 115572]|uniref:Uncharacterized protein n=1 Tax=Aspergillus sclerotioniger CBS 115572 TaxID=1450535 RepID=A0A317XEU4_9EURO|nr:hypothetical protein BO94DRAFT_18492 [Aspergillus sclerotioniger CBS 115572]PWY96741.1 hypothetical protein BO94DRAFT_18492 [Aspergillus sclerotioniger CBS 115572]
MAPNTPAAPSPPPGNGTVAQKSEDKLIQDIVKEIGNASTNESLRALFRSHLTTICKGKLDELKSEGPKYQRLMLSHVAYKMVTYVFEKFPHELVAEMDK